MEQTENEVLQNSENNREEPVDLIEIAKANAGEEYVKTEAMSNIFVMQLILCVMLILIFAVIKIIESQITDYFIDEFKLYSMSEPEEILRKAVRYAAGFIK